MNIALILKCAWQIVSGGDAIWAQVMRAKYFPASSFWLTQRDAPCTRLWRAMVQNRAVLAHNSRWTLGDGLGCPAYAQPWFREWKRLPAPTRQQLHTKVVSLFDNRTGHLDLQKLCDFAGNQIAIDIIREHAGVTIRPGIPDRLMFTWATNGEFFVKKAYSMLETLQAFEMPVPTDSESYLWKKIWKIKGVAPRIRMFFWKAIKGALPSAGKLASRIQGINPNCKLCNLTTEDASHAMLHCTHARLTWFMSPSGIENIRAPSTTTI